MKLPADDAANLALLRDAGLGVANCIPAVPSILPLRLPGMEGPPDPRERIAALCASMRRLAAYEPESVLCLTGRRRSRRRARVKLVIDRPARGRRRRCREPVCASGSSRASRAARVSLVRQPIAEALELLDEAGLDDVGLMADTYNLWHEPPDALAAIADRVTGFTSPTSRASRAARIACSRARAERARPSTSRALGRSGLGRLPRRRDLLDARRASGALSSTGGRRPCAAPSAACWTSQRRGRDAQMVP